MTLIQAPELRFCCHAGHLVACFLGSFFFWGGGEEVHQKGHHVFFFKCFFLNKSLASAVVVL